MVERLANIIATHMDLFYVDGAPPAGAKSAARAVIEAMMEPTPEMLRACWPNHHPWGRSAPPPEARPSLYAAMEHDVRSDLQAMLRTALSQPNDEGEGK